MSVEVLVIYTYDGIFAVGLLYGLSVFFENVRWSLCSEIMVVVVEFVVFKVTLIMVGIGRIGGLL